MSRVERTSNWSQLSLNTPHNDEPNLGNAGRGMALVRPHYEGPSGVGKTQTRVMPGAVTHEYSIVLERGPDGKWGMKVSCTKQGVLVVDIHPDSGAAVAWNRKCTSAHDYLRKGDVITRINDAIVDDWATPFDERCYLLMQELERAQTVRMEIRHEHA